jgi:hypothetical protein
VVFDSSLFPVLHAKKSENPRILFPRWLLIHGKVHSCSNSNINFRSMKLELAYLTDMPERALCFSSPSTQLPRPHMMNHSPPALRQWSIVDLVLWYCIQVDLDANPRGRTHVFDFPSTHPPDAVWLATAARTCKAWLDPALRYLHRTVTIGMSYRHGDLLVR